MNSMPDLSAVKTFMEEKVGLRGHLELIALSGGGNNQAYELRSNGGSYFLKHYFEFKGDNRDRLHTEFDFLTFVWRNGIRAVPKPIACDAERQLGLYEFIKGRAPVAEDLSLDMIKNALDFYQEINNKRNEPGAKRLSSASEAFFCLSDHLNCVEERLKRLKQICPESVADAEGASFVRKTVERLWHRIVSTIQDETIRVGIDPEMHITVNERCLSPSDFGFHNAIVGPGHNIRFIDFEYAGWDDPAKLVCDFFCQVGVPVEDRYLPYVIETVSSASPSPDRLKQRIRLLFPVYIIKWCCIILNVLLSAGKAKADFNRLPLSDEQKIFRLNKARRFIQEKNAMCHRHRDYLMAF